MQCLGRCQFLTRTSQQAMQLAEFKSTYPGLRWTLGPRRCGA